MYLLIQITCHFHKYMSTPLTSRLESHKIYYKFEGHAPEYISRDLRACAEIVSNLDAKMLQLNEAILEEKEKEEQKKKEE